MMEIRRNILFVAFACLAMMVNAAPVDVSWALNRAEHFVKLNTSGRLTGGTTSLQLVHAEPSATDSRWNDYYVFNATDGSAFVVVAGDDRVTDVLAHGDSPLDMTNLPCGLQWWFDEYRQQLEYLFSHPDAPIAKQWSSGMVIKPMLVSTWSQGEPYYDKCPVFRGYHCATGCVATAMAQVMYYWKYPAELSDLYGYTTGSLLITLPDLPPVEADWENMLEGYAWTWTPEQADAISTLMLYCGQSCLMDYAPGGSGSTSSSQLNGLRLMGYNLGARCLSRKNYEDAQWDSLLLADLAAGYPVLYTGVGEEIGHAFVLDGYDGSRYHINWGWEGSDDGYFYIDNLVVSGYDFNDNQQMLHNVYPLRYGVSSLPYDFEQDGLCYKVNGSEASVVSKEYSYNSYKGRVVIPETVTHDGVTLAVTAIGNNAFNRCSGLTSVVIPQSVKKIGNYAFKECTSLTSVTIPASVTSVGYAAFWGCTALSQVSFGNVRDLGYYAFAGCDKLVKLTLPGSVRTIGDGAFMGCTRLTSVNTGNGATSIGFAAFANCWRLKDVVIGNAVQTIGSCSFYGCYSLMNVKIGMSVETIDVWAFDECTSLTSLTLTPELPPYLVDENCFPDRVYSQATLYVPQISVEDYMFCERWDRFEHVVGIDMDINRADVNHDGEVNIADVNAVITAIMSGDIDGDVNNDGEVNIADINAVIEQILHGV